MRSSSRRAVPSSSATATTAASGSCSAWASISRATASTSELASSEHQQLRGACRRVDGDARGDLAAWPRPPRRCPGRRCGPPRGTDSRAVGQGGDGSRATEGEHPVHLGDRGRGEHGVRRAAHPGPGGEQSEHLAHPGDPRGHHAHQHAARVGGPAARRVDAHAGERVRPPLHEHARAPPPPGSRRGGRPRGPGRRCAPSAPAPGAARAGCAVQRRPDRRARHLERRRARRGRTGGRARAAPRHPGRARRRGCAATCARSSPSEPACPRPRRLRQRRPASSAGERPGPAHGRAHGSSLSMRVTRMPSPPSALSAATVR